MDENVKKLVVGGLLHDIGKVIQRSEKNGNKMTHSKWGLQYLQNRIGLENRSILDQVELHHYKEITEAFRLGKIDENSLAFITYCADNIAAGCDRRLRGEYFRNFKRYRALHSVFNSLNGGNERKHYQEAVLADQNKIPYPDNNIKQYSCQYYENLLRGMQEEMAENMTQCYQDWNYINYLISMLEKYWAFVPDCTNVAELADISLYDHVKMTAAFGCCMYQYAKEHEWADYRKIFLYPSKGFYKEKAFLIHSLDLSGIQQFIYNIHSEGALKTLRARSFYLGIFMEYIAEQLLERLGLSRVNILYSGGGHADFVLPNTSAVKQEIDSFVDEVNQWLVEKFNTALYLGSAYCQCSAYDLNSKDYDGKVTFGEIMEQAARELEHKKKKRYSADMIRRMNEKGNQISSDGRECKVCRRMDDLIPKSALKDFYPDADIENEPEEYFCKTCFSILIKSSDILNHKQNRDLEGNRTNGSNKDLFVILEKSGGLDERKLLPLPFGKYFLFADEKIRLPEYYKIYSKNSNKLLLNGGTHIWTADYSNGETLEDMANGAAGIQRIGVIRADVDNLGACFMDGFAGRTGVWDRNTISRKAAFSRMLSLFFQYYMNFLLSNGVTYLGEEPECKRRKASVVYSGGDDLFIVGSWDDMIGFAVDLYHEFQKYTQKTMTLSAGISIYPVKYPISSIARETGALLEAAKENKANAVYKKDKDSITLFSSGFTFHWECFINKVLGEKFKLIKAFFDCVKERGNAFLYHLLALLNQVSDPISLARYAFLIANLEPGKDAEQEEKDMYQLFKETLYQWMSSAGNDSEQSNDENDVKQCIAAIYLYIYLRRKKEDGEE